MQRVNWEAKSDYEYVQNYKLLQQAFAKHKVQRYVDVDKLIRAKYQGEVCCRLGRAYHDPGTKLTLLPHLYIHDPHHFIFDCRQFGILSMA